MAEGPARLAWDTTAELWALIGNAHRGSDSEAFYPWQVHPFRTREDYQPPPGDGDLLSGVTG